MAWTLASLNRCSAHLIQFGVVLLCVFFENTRAERSAISIKEKLYNHDICPTLLATSPEHEIEVVFNSMACPQDGRMVNFGDEIRPIETKVEPSVQYPAEPYSKHYTLIMMDPDAPSRVAPTMREWQHWLVVNIPGHDVMSGKVLTEYVGCSPANGTGLHRYIFIVYEQPRKNMTFDEPHLGRKADQYRTMFSTRRFADQYKLGEPWAVNFFLSQYEDQRPKDDEDDKKDDDNW